MISVFFLHQLALACYESRHYAIHPLLSQHISVCTSARNTRSSSVSLLRVPFRRTSFARLGTHCHLLC